MIADTIYMKETSKIDIEHYEDFTSQHIAYMKSTNALKLTLSYINMLYNFEELPSIA